jgi:hypothetical protein
MNRRLRKFLLAGVSLLAASMACPDGVKADPISATIVTAIGFTAGTTAATIATGVVTAALYTGASYAANALFGQSSSGPTGVRNEVQVGGVLPRCIAFGTVADAGHLIYTNGYGKKNKFRQRVYRLCDWQCDGLQAVYVNGERKTLTPVSIPAGNTEAARYHVDGFGSKMVVRWFAGTESQLADKELVDNAPAGRWTANHRGRGICYVSVTFTYDADLYQSGLPQLKFEYRGAVLYDRRKDDTAGGSGAHRWNDVSTWEWSANPIVGADNFCKGFYRQGVRIGGWGLPDAALSVGDMVAGQNLSDEGLTEGGESVSRYVWSCITSDGDQLRAGLQAAVDAVGGYYFEAGGIVFIKAGGAETAVATLTGDDRTDDAVYEYSQKLPRNEKVNILSGRFLDPDNGYLPVDYPQISKAADLAADNGEELALDIDLLSVPSGYQAERIARTRYNMGRLQGRITLAVPEKWIKLTVGDVIAYSDDLVGAGREWLIEYVERRRDQADIVLNLREYDAAAFEGASLFTPVVVVPPDIDPGATTVEGFAADGVKLDQGNGEAASIRLTWTPPGDDTVVGVKFEYAVMPGATFYGFDTDADPEGWTGLNATNVVAGGSLTHTASANDPILVSPSGLALDGSVYPVIRMRLRRLAGSDFEGTIFWSTGSGINYSKSVTMSAPAGIDGGFVVVEWDMSTAAGTGDDWVGSTIDQFQIHLGATADADESFAIDWIALLPSASAVVQQAQVSDGEGGEYYLTDGLLQNTVYQVRANLITDPVRTTDWTDWQVALTPVIASDVQLVKTSVYDTPGGPYSWTKASNPAVDPVNAIVIIETVGGGGGGAHGLQAGGGGGGAYSRYEKPYNQAPSGLDIYVGAGGQGSSGGSSSNADVTLGVGGLSYVVDSSDSTNVLSAAYGGGPGEGSGTQSQTILGGGGGGLLGAGGAGKDGSAAGELGGGRNTPENVIIPPTFDGGGGAGNTGIGGRAVSGGGGGGGSAFDGGAGGVSRLSGNGGDGGAATGGAGDEGFSPGGGGGAGKGGTSGGDGGRGEVRITVIG